MLADTVMTILEIIGTIAFAISGAFIAISVKMDIFGVVFIGCTTAFGGGIVRDLLIGRIPPAVFQKFELVIIAAVAAVAVFVIAALNKKTFNPLRAKIENINNIFDAMGLAAFAVMGTEVAFSEGFSDNPFLSVILGMLTGVGGGIIRDILTDSTPVVFKKYVYAIAAIAGSILYYILRINTDNPVWPTILAMVLVFMLRMLATKYRWSLPKINFEENKEK
ncbi:MAG: trimeric intracellular cation channel family protein [Oscillospiraceae bacterium]|nr:trimeric intracellular cation channel family protein [Oscillospiraceae bacterium]